MKLRNHKIARTTVLLVLATVLSNFSFAQCKKVVEEGVKKLSPYSFNGQTNTLTIKGSKPAQLSLPFYKGYTYKLQITPEADYAAKVSFRVLDANKNELFNSTANSNSESWSFYSNSTQELVIEVTSTEKAKQCVAVLVGVQIPKKNSMRDL